MLPLVTVALTHPCQARRLVEPLVELVCRYTLPLSEFQREELLITWLLGLPSMVSPPDNTPQLISEFLAQSLTPSSLASKAFDATPAPSQVQLVPHLPEEKIDTLLETTNRSSVLRALARHSYVASSPQRATRLLNHAPRVFPQLMKSATPAVQQMLANTDQHADAIIALLKKDPQALKPGVTLPAPLVARVLATANPARRAELVPLISRTKRN